MNKLDAVKIPTGRMYRALRREAAAVARQDWSRKTAHGNVERDRYAQGLRDAATMVLQMADRIAWARKPPARKAGQK